jgi:hypothetical protein
VSTCDPVQCRFPGISPQFRCTTSEGNGADRSWNELELKVQRRHVEPRMAVLNSLLHQADRWSLVDLAGQAVTGDGNRQ